MQNSSVQTSIGSVGTRPKGCLTLQLSVSHYWLKIRAPAGMWRHSSQNINEHLCVKHLLLLYSPPHCILTLSAFWTLRQHFVELEMWWSLSAEGFDEILTWLKHIPRVFTFLVQDTTCTGGIFCFHNILLSDWKENIQKCLLHLISLCL